MAQLYKFFNSSEYKKREYNAEDFSSMFSHFISTGLIHIDNQPFLDVKVSEGESKVILSEGAAVIDGHLYENTCDLFLDVEPVTSTFERIDRLVIRCDSREEYLHVIAFVIKGVPSSNPVPPEVTRNSEMLEISLAQINVSASGIILKDERFDDSVCGLASSLFSIPLKDMKDNFGIFKDQLNTEYNNWISDLEKSIEVTDIRQDLELIKRNQAELLMQRYLEGKSGAGERGYFYDTLSDTKKIDPSNTTAVVDTAEMKIDLPPSSLNGHVTWKTHPIGFVASKVRHYHTRPIGQLLEVVEDAYGGSNTIKVKNIEVTVTEVN